MLYNQNAWSTIKRVKFTYYTPIINSYGLSLYGKPCKSREEAILYIRLNFDTKQPDISYYIAHAGDIWTAYLDEDNWYNSFDSRRLHSKIIDHIFWKPIHRTLKKIIV